MGLDEVVLKVPIISLQTVYGYEELIYESQLLKCIYHPDYIVEIKEQVHSRFNGVVIKPDLRHVISFFQQQQIILDKVDSVSHKYSDSESRNFLLSAQKALCKSAGHLKFDTFDKLKNFLTTVALPREADRVDNTRNGNLLNAASAERVSYNRENNNRSDRNRPRYDSRGNPQQSRRRNDRNADSRNRSRNFEQQRTQPRDSNANSPSVCFKCSRSFNTVREAANHAR